MAAAAVAEVAGMVGSALESLLQGRLPPAELSKALVSKLLGYGILMASVLVKLPQVSNVLRSRSAEGLSVLSFELESLGLLVHTSYGYLKGLPFSAYGEAIMLFAQNVLLLALVYRFARVAAARQAAVATAAAAAATAVLSGHVSLAAVSGLYDANNLILIGARLPQIWTNFANRSTGQLSIVTFAANTLGCIARLFTTMQEGGGAAMMRAYAISLALNSILVAQILVWGNRGVAASKGRAKAKPKAA